MQTRKTGGFVVAAIVAFSASVVLASAATAPTTVKTAKISSLGTVLVNASGLTLYRFTTDKKGSSSCTGACAALWPPLLATAKPTAGKGVTASKLGMLKRSNGQKQVTYEGFPLYRYAGDRKPGQAKGEGTEGTWYAVAGSGSLVKPSAAAQSAGSGTASATTTPDTSPGGYGY